MYFKNWVSLWDFLIVFFFFSYTITRDFFLLRNVITGNLGIVLTNVFLSKTSFSFIT